jgi:hypothetical protein
MRNSTILFAALGALTIFALPAAAKSDEGSCGAPSTVAPSGPIDMEAIPLQEPTGQKAVKGIGDDDDCSDSHSLGKAASIGRPENTENMDEASQNDDD